MMRRDEHSGIFQGEGPRCKIKAVIECVAITSVMSKSR